ncbi:hypothetical protein V4W63_32865 [Pseudomonas aeruginosa]|uniref:hypothetical protein n=1 Tax=Pseudomonas aeruginosa TaxID=287 RepID=UPI0007098351|nr:hypothetical protein [Pseudomonas aeruginosa]ALY40150.1 hypothetical protein HW09_04445 [Pseudomonas aeruginosa]OXZ12854.1 hypothetical protein ACG90_22240 [Pseudomonas aeruginosa]SSU34347.1 Uncharacterised protein [Acinetobacter baumannii]
MAALNGTQAGVSSVVQGFVLPSATPAQLEKISCWNGGSFSADPFVFLGRRIRVGEQLQACYGDERDLVDESIVYAAKVLGVHIGSAADGIESSLLLRLDGYEYEDYVDISRLTVLEVLE